RVPIPPFMFVLAFGCIMLTVILLRDFFNYLGKALNSHFGARFWVSLLVITALLVTGMILWMQTSLWDFSPLTVGIIGVIAAIIFLFSGMPVAFGLLLVGFLGLVHLRGFDAGFNVLGTVLFRYTANYIWVVIPFFMLMGYIAFYARLSEDLYRTAYKWIGHQPGGLAMATVGACAVFAAVVADNIAGAVSIGAAALPEMKKYGYDPRLATGCVCAGGTIGVLIPPSIGFIIYGVITEQSIGKLFIAGILPGILLALIFMILIYTQCRINPKFGPRGPSTGFVEKLTSLKFTWSIMLLIVLVIGGIYAGIFTPSEAGAIGVTGILLIVTAMRRFNRRLLVRALLETGKISSMALLILVCTSIFGYFLAASKLPMLMAEFVAGLAVHRLIIFVAILVVYAILGAIMPAIPMLILTIPIFLPIFIALDFNLIWVGVMLVIMMQMACITPPYGITCFAIRGVAKDIPLGTIFQGVLPYVAGMAACIGILMAFPIIATFLPSALAG
ncbi:TRAP transporter large permease, partial [Chloroflexota bacterium]